MRRKNIGEYIAERYFKLKSEEAYPITPAMIRADMSADRRHEATDESINAVVSAVRFVLGSDEPAVKSFDPEAVSGYEFDVWTTAYSMTKSTSAAHRAVDNFREYFARQK